MKIKNETFDLISGSSAVFEPNFAFYAGEARGVRCAVKVTVPGKGCAKQVDVLFENTTDREIRLDCAYYTEPVLGVNRRNSRLISPQFRDGKLLFHNPFNTAVKSHMALSCDRQEVRAICDRVGFLNGDWEKSAAAPCADLCGALVTGIELPPRRKEKVRFVLSYGMTERSAAQLAELPLPKPEADKNRIRIQTPDAYLDHLVNTWLPWQTLGARVMARIGFYQAGGAYGFRDQLQDVTSYLLIDPKWAKRQILRCAAVQFEEGDVMHWWHILPKNAGGLKGVRTRYSDDLLWLPYAVCEYVEKTGDSGILDIETRYLSAPVLKEHEHELYLEPGIAPRKGSVYEHCLRAIDHAMRLGEYGLPLMGSGDWNDGYNTVGAGGRGQSVWLAMFLVIVLERFSALCERRSDSERAEKLREDAEKLRRNIDENAWDGDWYLRAFYDDLSKMGTHEDTECKIDSLPQSFAVLCGMPDRERVNTALSNAWRYLVDEKGRVVKLFTEAFDKSDKDPGYVKAYPKGVRENGGQYTHGAIWFAMALLENGDCDKGYQLLQILNPAYRCSNQELAERYKLEPYYIAADIYTGRDYYGRGGWSIYTGSAGWYYRTAVESLLGVYKKGDVLELSPRIPSSWDGFRMQLTLDGTQLDVSVRRGGAYRLEVDGKEVSTVHLDGGKHTVELQIA